MNATPHEPTLQELVTRLAELERANARMAKELADLRAEQVPSAQQAARANTANQGPTTFSGSGLGTVVVQVEATNSATGIVVSSDDHAGIEASSLSFEGVFGGSRDWIGVLGLSTNGVGVFADVSGAPIVFPLPDHVGLLARGGSHNAIFATSDSATGVVAQSTSGTGVFAQSNSGTGVIGVSPQGSLTDAGVFGSSSALDSNGVIGEANNGTDAYGVWGKSTGGYAGFFSGNVTVMGTLSKGSGGFRIDHPLDPENKYLSHSFVESPDMLNVYNGNVTTDANGDATVMLPDYFETLNQDFRYQLTVIGQFAQAMVAQEIRNNQFTIKTDRPNVRVSWQVTGVRKDPFANMHRVLAEEDKRANERGMYLHPKAYGKPETQSIELARGKVLKGP
jgi:hypothetical protein